MSRPRDPLPLLTRRQALAVSGAGALGATLWLAGCGGDDAPASSGTICVLTPEQTEGPYYVEDSRVRSDITEGREGMPLELVLAVQKVGGCAAIADATVEVWHCDALGVYSGSTAAGAGGGGGGAPPEGAGPPPGGRPDGPPPGGGGGGSGPTDDETFLRGAQRSDGRGVARFRTVFPGWYQGRTPHIHLKVHVGGNEVHTGQLYFDDKVTAAVYRTAPYSSHGEPSTTNATDGIYSDGGKQSTLEVTRAGEGLVGRLTLGIQA